MYSKTKSNDVGQNIPVEIISEYTIQIVSGLCGDVVEVDGMSDTMNH